MQKSFQKHARLAKYWLLGIESSQHFAVKTGYFRGGQEYGVDI